MIWHNMKNMNTTSLFITVLVIVLAIYDLIAYLFGGEGMTISRVMQDIGFDAPFITFSIGCLCGHFFMYMPVVCNKCKDKKE